MHGINNSKALNLKHYEHLPFKDEVQTALFKDSVRTAQ
jgi:hypothetical protein